MSVTTGKLRVILSLVLAAGLGAVPLAHAATLSATFTTLPQGSVVNLTAEGALDWVHWGLITETSIDRKAGVPPQIPGFTRIHLNGPYQYGDNFNGYSWSDGAPTSSVTNTTTGVWMFGKSNGFELNVPAGTSTRILKVYVGTYGAVGKFDATLSGTQLNYSDASISNVSNGPGGFYTLTYAADSPGQTLNVKYVVDRVLDNGGNVTLQAAALTAPGEYQGRRCCQRAKLGSRELLAPTSRL